MTLKLFIAFFALVGLAFCTMLLYQVFWHRIAYRFKRKSYNESVEKSKAEQRLIAKRQNKKKHIFNKGTDQEVIVWATSGRIASKKYNKLSPKKKRPIEIF